MAFRRWLPRSRSCGTSSLCTLSKPALEFRISARYGNTEVLHDVAASLADREILALVGLSGSGKSTLALSLLRLLHYRGGAVTGNINLAGKELASLSERDMRAVRGKLIGYVPQS